MSKIFEDNSLTIGHTPLVRLNRIGNGRILAKVESRNPSFSVKCRIGANMIWDAEKRGVLKPGVELVEPTSGNTGIALAYVAAARGYKLTLTMPETMSIERRKLLKALGANLVLTEGAKGMKGAIQKAEEIVASNPEQFLLLQQFSNPANPEIHEKTTGPEIWEDTDGQVDVFISGVGTGGTLTGVSRYIKNTKGKKDLITVAVEPTDSPVIAQALAGRAQAGSAQNSGYRRRLHSWQPGSEAGRQSDRHYQRGSYLHGAPPDGRRRHPGGYLFRGRRCRRAEAAGR